jgi:hypothetical protein
MKPLMRGIYAFAFEYDWRDTMATITNHDAATKLWGHADPMFDLNCIISYLAIKSGARLVQAQMGVEGRIVTIRKMRDELGTTWAYHFFSEGDMHSVSSDVSLADVMQKGTNLSRVYSKVYIDHYRRNALNPVKPWDHQTMSYLWSLGLQRHCAMVFGDGGKAYEYTEAK